MLVLNSKDTLNKDAEEGGVSISKKYLQYVVESIAIPRHYIHESKNNAIVKKWIKSEFESFGLMASYQGQYQNVVARSGASKDNFLIIIGAHFDSVPNSPGADDNASAVAGMLGLAKALKEYGDLPILYIAFNREEDGLLGSQEFVKSLTTCQSKKIICSHVLEMIGYCSNAPHSQSMPQGLPIKISDTGNFISVISNKHSNNLLKPIINTGHKYVPQLPIKALKVFLGVEKLFPHLLRSDHAPFWADKIPSLMWTDTSEFRNPNYHQESDTPDTLDYDFMHNVVKLIGNTILYQLEKANE